MTYSFSYVGKIKVCLACEVCMLFGGSNAHYNISIDPA